jgi:hypothetical protein
VGKKSTGGAFCNVEERCQIIEWLYQTSQRQGWGYSIRQLCKLLAVNRAWFYERKKVIERREKEEAELKAVVEGILLEFNGYGYRRVTKALHRAGYRINAKKVLRLLREWGCFASLYARRSWRRPRVIRRQHTPVTF